MLLSRLSYFQYLRPTSESDPGGKNDCTKMHESSQLTRVITRGQSWATFLVRSFPFATVMPRTKAIGASIADSIILWLSGRVASLSHNGVRANDGDERVWRCEAVLAGEQLL